MESVALARCLMSFPEKAGAQALFVTVAQAVDFCNARALGIVKW